jgi:protein-disulfide isomerase
MLLSLRTPLVGLALTSLLSACADGGGAAVAGGPTGTPSTVASPGEGLPDPVAKVGDRTVTLEALEDKAAPAVAKATQDIYLARRAALDGLITDMLLEDEAKKRGITVEELLKVEVKDKVPPVTDADIEAFYAQNQARIRQPIEAVREQVRGHLEQQSGGGRQAEFVASLRTAAGVEEYLGPPRFQVDVDGQPRRGAVDAPIQIVEFSDFQCPYCKVGAETITQVEARYGDQVSVVFRNFPLPMHREAKPAAEASECANDQGKFWEYHDQLFANPRALTKENLITYAGTVGLDLPKFTECIESGVHAASVEDDVHDGEKVAMSGTPGFYVNGRMLGGAQPLEAFAKVIDEELARAGRPVPPPLPPQANPPAPPRPPGGGAPPPPRPH